MAKQHVIAVDPGDANNGFVYFKYDPETKKADTVIMQILTPEVLSKRLMQIWYIGQQPGYEPKNMHFVVENFRVDSHVRGAMFQWNEMKTSKQIGKVEFVAESLGAPITLQEPANVLAMGRKWGPWRKLPKHIPDDKSAWLHGANYMMKTMKWFSTVDSITMFGQEML